MKELEGKTVTGLAVSEDAHYLRFDVKGEASLFYQAEADCCSETWFADIVGVQALLGQEVRAVIELELAGYDTQDGRCKQDTDQAYGYQLQTAKGRVDIVFRNSSNGYYGGDLSVFEGEPQGLSFETIEDDWMDAGGWPEDKALALKESRALDKTASKTTLTGARAGL